MGFYIRKSISAGPFRFNLSKSGVGLSVGIKGLRIGTGPRGHYVQAGRGGIYYRASLGMAGDRQHHTSSSVSQPLPVQTLGASAVDMIEIESGSVMEMRGEAHSDLLDEINGKQQQMRLSFVLGGGAFALSMLLTVLIGAQAIPLVVVVLPAYLIGLWLDSFHRAAVVYYDLDESVTASYGRLTTSFDGLAECAKIWHIEANGAVKDLTTWKRNAGASSLVRRKTTEANYKLPSTVKCNLTPPALRVGRQVIYFMPDVMLIQDGSVLGSVSYSDLSIVWKDARFIEEEGVPADARIVDRTWKYPNKKGGPDRRFKDNRELPICLYETAHFTSQAGVNELVEFSKNGVVKPFADALQAMTQAVSSKPATKVSA